MMFCSTKTSGRFIVLNVSFTSINLYVKVFLLFMLKYSVAGFFLQFFNFFRLLNLNRSRRLNVK